MPLKYNSDKFDSCLNTYRDKISYNLSAGATEPDQTYEASTMMPLDFSLEMDGISGIIPNSAFEVPSNVLPHSYLTRGGKPKVAFILHTIDHNFDNNKWTTKITGQTLNIRFDGLTDAEKSAREKSRLQNQPQTNPTLFTPFPENPIPISPGVVNTVNALTRLKNLIGNSESNNNYGVANTGGGARRSSTNVNGLTFNVLKTFQNIKNESNPQRVFAAGRFQIIPETMSIITSAIGLKGTDRYDPITQEKMADYMLLYYRKSVGDYIKGKNAGSLNDLTSAINSIGYEWASMPVVKKSEGGKVGDVVAGTGQAGNYGGTGANPSKAKVSVKLMANTLISARILYGSKKPTFIPTYYNNFT
tara:strand:+ start:311 stop:1390 length:1080 start_codon:yes stop_codon:yes gene_type:complete